MEELYQEIAESAKFLAGTFARVSPLPEVLWEIIFSYMEAWRILDYTGEIARNPIPEIMPSIEATHLYRTLNIFSTHNHRPGQMMRVLCNYEIADQVRILDKLTHVDVIELFRIRNFRNMRQLKATKKHREDQRGRKMLAILMGSSNQR